MFTEITTTITSKLDLDTMETEHSAELWCKDDGAPPELVYAVAAGACKATILALPEHVRANVLPLTEPEKSDESDETGATS